MITVKLPPLKNVHRLTCDDQCRCVTTFRKITFRKITRGAYNGNFTVYKAKTCTGQLIISVVWCRNIHRLIYSDHKRSFLSIVPLLLLLFFALAPIFARPKYGMCVRERLLRRLNKNSPRSLFLQNSSVTSGPNCTPTPRLLAERPGYKE